MWSTRIEAFYRKFLPIFVSYPKRMNDSVWLTGWFATASSSALFPIRFDLPPFWLLFLQNERTRISVSRFGIDSRDDDDDDYYSMLPKCCSKSGFIFPRFVRRALQRNFLLFFFVNLIFLVLNFFFFSVHTVSVWLTFFSSFSILFQIVASFSKYLCVFFFL